MAIHRPRNSRAADRASEPGHDSFLDVVANLIGILIILVMLIGSQAQTVWEQLRSERETSDVELESLESDVQNTQSAVAKLKSENGEIEKAIAAHQRTAAQKKRERDQVQLAVHAIQKAIVQQKNKLSSEQKQQQELVSTVSFLQEELESIKGKTQSLQTVKPQISVIDHLPTPIAKTVFGEEIHFRLLGGRLVYVPLNELVELMRSEWKVKAKKLMQTPSTIETVGPINNFRLQYKLVLTEHVQRTEHGAVRSMVPGLDRFILLPTASQMGEPFDQALETDSQFRRRLAGLDPRETTISVWVYPDSFGQFNRLKKILYENGFLCAGWPLPKDQPISGSPNGFRAVAQ